MITKKGDESLLAVIYIDGNNTGAQVKRCLSGLTYTECVKALREFSGKIQKHYIDDRIQDVDSLLAEKERSERRFVVYAGDEVTFICNARNDYDVAVEYLTKLAADSPEGALLTSCAGIAIFHSHAPFAEAYRIAEECCESGKKLMKKEGMENNSRSWFVSLTCGKKEKEAKEIRKPEMVNGKFISCEIVQMMKEMLNRVDWGNIKNLTLSAKKAPQILSQNRSEFVPIRSNRTTIL